ncbi:hypothetical protein OXX80_006150 [Metschnikowia pulcherrima]
MQFLTLLSLAVALVNGMVIPGLDTRDEAAPLQLDFTVSKAVGNTTAKEFWAKYGSKNKKRDAYPEVITDYRDLSYQIDVYLGADKQKNTVSLDTGSSDLWVPSSGYSPDSSSSAQDTGEAFKIGYLDGSGASGEYYKDKFQFSTAKPVLSNFQFAQTSDEAGMGILGIADRNQEASDSVYDNLPWALQKAGITPKASYSLFLGPDLGKGSLIFGGIDTDKYTGELQSHPIDSSSGGLAVDVQSVNFNGKIISVNAPVLLDSGTSLGLLSSDLIEELDTIFDSQTVKQGGIEYKIVSCDQPSDKSLDFDFGDNTISIPFSEAIIKQDDGTCLLGFGYYNDIQIFGDVFLRQAYVYYDLTDKTISLAQASYSSSSNIISA